MNNLPRIQMQLEFSFKGKNFDKDFGYIDVGGFTFIINNKEIPFDFEAYTNFIDERNERIYVEYVSGKGVFFNSYILDSCYHDEYKEIGLDLNDINAEYLSKVSEIEEIYIGNDDIDKPIEDIKIHSISIIDIDNDIEYIIDKDIINKYNKRLNEK